MNCHEIRYNVSRHNQTSLGTLIEWGANGGIVGSDVRVKARTDRSVDVSCIDNHQMIGLPIVTARGVMKSQRDEVIYILHQYAHVPQGKIIHSCVQMELSRTHVDDKSMKIANGTQMIRAIGGYKFH